MDMCVLCLFPLQSQRSSAPVPPWPAQRHHLCPGPEGRHHHQTLAGPAGEEPPGGSGHRCPGHPSTPAVTPLHSSSPTLTNTSKELPNRRWWRWVFSFNHEHTDRHAALFLWKTWKGIIFVFRSTSSAIPLPWIHGFKDFHVCCLAVCCPTD